VRRMPFLDATLTAHIGEEREREERERARDCVKEEK